MLFWKSSEINCKLKSKIKEHTVECQTWPLNGRMMDFGVRWLRRTSCCLQRDSFPVGRGCLKRQVDHLHCGVRRLTTICLPPPKQATWSLSLRIQVLVGFQFESIRIKLCGKVYLDSEKTSTLGTDICEEIRWNQGKIQNERTANEWLKV